MTENSRKLVSSRYAQSGREYDDVRLRTFRGQLLTEQDVRLFESLLPANPGAAVVEVGAGTGRFTIPALRRGLRPIATDVNPSLLDGLRAKLADAGLAGACELRTEDVFALSFPEGSLDLIYCIHVIPRFTRLDDQRAALAEMARTLRPGGRLLFNYRNARSLLYGRFDREHAATPGQIQEALAAAGLRIEAERGKWLLNGRVVDLLPRAAARAVAALDRRLWRFHPHRAWDVFVLAVKD